jgi:hypothetical protein
MLNDRASVWIESTPDSLHLLQNVHNGYRFPQRIARARVLALADRRVASLRFNGMVRYRPRAMVWVSATYRHRS